VVHGNLKQKAGHDFTRQFSVILFSYLVSSYVITGDYGNISYEGFHDYYSLPATLNTIKSKSVRCAWYIGGGGGEGGF